MTPYNKAIIGGILSGLAAVAGAASQLDFSQGIDFPTAWHLAGIFVSSVMAVGGSVYLVPNSKAAS